MKFFISKILRSKNKTKILLLNRFFIRSISSADSSLASKRVRASAGFHALHTFQVIIELTGIQIIEVYILLQPACCYQYEADCERSSSQ